VINKKQLSYDYIRLIWDGAICALCSLLVTALIYMSNYNYTDSCQMALHGVGLYKHLYMYIPSWKSAHSYTLVFRPDYDLGESVSNNHIATTQTEQSQMVFMTLKPL